MVTTFVRKESKFPLTEAQYQTLLPALSQETAPDPYCIDGREYTVYSLYFDTEQNDVIRSSISKPYYKEKLRLRSYRLPESLETEVFLELKKKVGGIGNKCRALLPYGAALAFVQSAGAVTPDAADMQILREIGYFLKRHPVSHAVYVAHDRAARCGMQDAGLRITFDHNLRVRRERADLLAGDWGEPLLPESVRLMEIKTPGALPLRLTRLLSEPGVYSRGFSKYGSAYQMWKGA